MKKLVLSVVFMSMALFGCNSVKAPIFNSDIVIIDEPELSQYWIADTSKVIMLSGRPDWLPNGAGKASFYITIDSNGASVDRELISSIPDGWMTQKLLDKMPIQQYEPSIANPIKIPVKVKIWSEVKPRTDLNIIKA